MATLTETAYYSRKYIKIGAIAIVGLLVLRVLFDIAVGYLLRAFPPVTLKPNNAFNVLPKIAFPQIASPSGELTFTLQTIEGSIPEASDAARVFFMPKGRSSLLSLSRTQSFVGKMGFTTTPRQLADTLYRWIDIKNPLRTIEMDVVSNHFTLTYLYQHDLNLFTEKNISSPQVVSNEALGFLRSLNLPITDIAIDQPKVQYLKLEGNELVPATSQSQAEAVRVDFFRTNIEGMKLVTDTPNESNITFIMSGSKNQDKRMLYVRYRSWPISLASNGIYKLKTSEQAWVEFLAGKAYIASFTPGQTQIPITNVYLAYYDGSISQLFLQPVFVIEGTGNFVAYVPAVAAPWAEN